MYVFPAPRHRLLAGGAALMLVLALLGGMLLRPAPPAVEESDGRGILLALAAAAVREQRLVAPAGSNAYEFYLSVLELAPDDAATGASLRRLFPTAARAVEQAIDRGDLDEAARELRLLRDFDHDSYLLALLAGKLDAQRQLLVRRHEARAAMLQAQRAPAARPAG